MIASPTRTPEDPMPRPALAYIRVSTEAQAQEDRVSLPEQRRAIERLAAELGAEVTRWFEDAGISGATAERRPGFQALLAEAAARPRPQLAPGVVLVLNASRFGRWEDPEEAAYWRHTLRRHGWHVRFVEGDAEGDAAPIIRAVQSVEASAYRRNLQLNTRRGMKANAQLGNWTREAPIGYRRAIVGSGKVLELGERKPDNVRVRLVPHPEEAALVRWIFEAYASGEHGLGSLAEALLVRAPGRRWSRTVVNHLLKNEAYRGAVVGGRRRNAAPERYVCEGAHPPIVPPELWQAVQDRLAKNARLGPGSRSPYLLTGLLTCAVCGSAYHGGGGGRSRTARPRRALRRFYRDAGGISGACPGPIGTVMRHIVDDAAIDLVAKIAKSPRARRAIDHAVERALRGHPGETAATEAALRAARARAEQRIERLTAAIADGTLRPEEAAPQLDAARAAARQATEELEAARFIRRSAAEVHDQRDRLLQALSDFPALAARADTLRLRRLIEPWVARATFHKQTRVLTVGIRMQGVLALNSQPARTGRFPDGLIVRSRSLVQPGQEWRVRTSPRVVHPAHAAES